MLAISGPPRRPVRDVCRVVGWSVLFGVCGRASAADGVGPTPVEAAKASLTELRKQPGPLKVEAFLSVAVDAAGNPKLPLSDLRALWLTFTGMLRPPLTKDELKVYHEALRGAVADVSVTYQYRSKGVSGAGEKRDYDQTVQFAASGGRLLQRIQSRGPGGVDTKRAYAYDGEVERTATSDTRGANSGAVSRFKGSESYYNVEANPLLLAMMIDARKAFGIPSSLIDLNSFLEPDMHQVFEERRAVDGRPCVVVGAPGLIACFDPERQFCLTMVEVLHDDDPYGRRPPKLRRVLSGHKDVGNGVWLPSRVVTAVHDKAGQPTLQEEVDVTEWRVGTPLPKEYFADIIPAGAMVLDDIKGISYFAGENGSIEQVLAEGVVPPRQRPLFTRVVIATNLAVFAGVLALLWWRRRRPLPVPPPATPS